MKKSILSFLLMCCSIGITVAEESSVWSDSMPEAQGRAEESHHAMVLFFLPEDATYRQAFMDHVKSNDLVLSELKDRYVAVILQGEKHADLLARYQVSAPAMVITDEHGFPITCMERLSPSSMVCAVQLAVNYVKATEFATYFSQKEKGDLQARLFAIAHLAELVDPRYLNRDYKKDLQLLQTDQFGAKEYLLQQAKLRQMYDDGRGELMQYLQQLSQETVNDEALLEQAIRAYFKANKSIVELRQEALYTLGVGCFLKKHYGKGVDIWDTAINLKPESFVAKRVQEELRLMKKKYADELHRESDEQAFFDYVATLNVPKGTAPDMVELVKVFSEKEGISGKRLQNIVGKVTEMQMRKRDWASALALCKYAVSLDSTTSSEWQKRQELCERQAAIWDEVKGYYAVEEALRPDERQSGAVLYETVTKYLNTHELSQEARQILIAHQAQFLFIQMRVDKAMEKYEEALQLLPDSDFAQEILQAMAEIMGKMEEKSPSVKDVEDKMKEVEEMIAALPEDVKKDPQLLLKKLDEYIKSPSTTVTAKQVAMIRQSGLLKDAEAAIYKLKQVSELAPNSVLGMSAAASVKRYYQTESDAH